ncbi:hypothetical protein FB451DRAFT_1164277 [Mycena latifolia]|nr:hypothetical protein FB451DRAFT_1164277 [Mycena latifolia]
MATDDNGDSVHQFVMECHKISTEAQFIMDSLPNTETPAVERVTHQLDTIRDVLLGLNDPHLSGNMLGALITYDLAIYKRQAVIELLKSCTTIVTLYPGLDARRDNFLQAAMARELFEYSSGNKG